MPLTVSMTVRLQHQHEVITDLIRGLPEEKLKQRIQPDKWSAFEQLVHLTAYQPTFSARLRKMELEENPLFTPYVADHDPLFHDYLQRSVKEIQDDLGTQRFIISNHLAGLSEQNLRRTGQHPKYGLLTIGEWTELFLLHEAHHLFKLFELTGQLRAAQQHL